MFPYIPEWVGRLIVFFLIVGIITVFIGGIAGIVWLCNHIRFV